MTSNWKSVTGAAAALLIWAMPAGAETLSDALASAYRNSGLIEQNRAVLRAADEDFEKFCAAALDWLTWDEQLDAMEYVPVTRLMSVKQFAEYLTAVDQLAAKQQIQLTHPDDLYWDALMQSRPA